MGSNQYVTQNCSKDNANTIPLAVGLTICIRGHGSNLSLKKSAWRKTNLSPHPRRLPPSCCKYTLTEKEKDKMPSHTWRSFPCLSGGNNASNLRYWSSFIYPLLYLFLSLSLRISLGGPSYFPFFSPFSLTYFPTTLLLCPPSDLSRFEYV